MIGQPKNGKNKKWIRTTLVVLALLLAVLLFFLVIQYRSLRHGNLLNVHGLRWPLFLGHRAPLPPASAGVIRDWMTFNYINRLFALPTDYLKTTLPISDPAYPQLTISEYAEHAGKDAAAVLDAAQKAVSSYAAPGQPSGQAPNGATGTATSSHT